MEKKEEKKNIWEVGEVPTQTQPVIYNTKDEKQYDIYQALAKILNDIEEIKRYTTG